MHDTAVFEPTLLMETVALGTKLLTAQRGLSHESEHKQLSDQQTRISGGVMQTSFVALEKLESEQDTLLAALQTAFRTEVLRQYLQLNPSVEAETLDWSGTKVLAAPPGDGEQAIHWDSTRWSVNTPETTALLYSSDCMTARTPRFSRREQLPLHIEQADPPADKQLRAQRSFLLREEYFHSVPVRAGTLFLFRHTVPHAGSRNIAQTPRIALFDMLVPKLRPPAAEQQYFSWHYVGDSSGRSSKPYIQHLAVNSKYAPLCHESAPEELRLRKIAKKFNIEIQ